MRAARVLFFVCFALLVVAVGCTGNFNNSTSQALNPGTGTTSPAAPGAAPTPTPSATPTPAPGATPTPTPAPTPSLAGFLYAIENPNAPAIVEGFSISDNGSLAPISTTNAGTFATEIVANSRFVFVGDSQHRPTPIQLTSYSIGSSGALTMADQVTFSNNNDDTMTGFLLDSTGAHLYAGSEFVMIGGRVSTYAVDGASGHMTFQAPESDIGRPVGHMAMSPNGIFVYVAVFPQHHTAEFPGIRLLLRDPVTGTLTDTGRQFPTTCCDQYTDLAPALGGKYLIGVQNSVIPGPNNSKLTVFAVNPVTGDLTRAFDLIGDFSDIVVDRTGQFAILPNTTGTVASYRINADGTFTRMGTVPAITGVNNVVVDATNKFVYVQSSTTAQIFALTFDESSGALGHVPGSPFTTSGVPIRMAAVGK